MSILGTRVVRVEDPRFLKGEGTYIANLQMPGAVHLTFVRSSIAHAQLLSIDADEARSMPGVLHVWTAEDINLNPAPPANPMMNAGITFPYVAKDTVRFVGDIVAVVVSTDKTLGIDAAETVIVDHEPLPVVLDMDESFKGDVLLHPEAGSNTVLTFAAREDGDIFADCEVVVELTIENQRVAPAPMEVRSCASQWDGTRLTQWACSQGAHGARDGLADTLGLEKEQVRVITPDVGGGFGAKSGVYAEEIIVGWAALKLGVPVRWTESRTENMLSMGHGRAQRQRTRMGGTKDGRITAYRLDLLQDAGAYAKAGAVLPYMTRLMAGGVYDIAKVQFESHSVVTNTTPTVAYRGAGRPEATAAIERTIDEFARVCGVDPAEIRRRNYLQPSAFPLVTSMGAKYDSGEYEAALDKALEAAGYAELRAEQARRRASNNPLQIGIGLASYVETTNPMGSGDYGSVEIKADGGAIIRTGSSSHGQGHHTAWAMLVSDATGIPFDRIEFHFGDTDDVVRGGGTGGSRSLQVGGSAVKLATDAVLEKARQRAADLLEAAVEDIVIDTVRGAFHVAGSPAPARTWAELMVGLDAPLEAEVDYVPEGATFPFGSHVCVVEVDIETGMVGVMRHIACDDAGTIINPLIVDGQVHGGIAQGVAQALLETVAYDEDGNPITSNLADYGFISAAELPSFERVSMETPTPRNPLGAKGIGEAGTIGATPAVHNAVIDAVSHLGVTHIDMPCTSINVWNAIQAAR
jgi:carbon-monoxide dehydrogenase large subunit